MLLDDGLGEHMLVELCSRWTTDLERMVKAQGRFEEMKNNIEALMRHCGETEQKICQPKHVSQTKKESRYRR